MTHTEKNARSVIEVAVQERIAKALKIERADITVTPEMVRAGWNAYRDCMNDPNRGTALAKENGFVVPIYRAMRKARNESED